jgi:hypothetical protein
MGSALGMEKHFARNFSDKDKLIEVANTLHLYEEIHFLLIPKIKGGLKALIQVLETKESVSFSYFRYFCILYQP